MKISSQQALQLVNVHGHTVFGVKFVKADGTIRAMACRLHASQKAVEKNKTGRKQSPNSDPYMVKVWDMNKPDENGKGAFRTVNFNNLLEITISNRTFEVANL
jgi:hypothetical protein